MPPDLPADKAVSVILDYATAYQLLARAARLKQGDTAFLCGLASGVGTAMRQIAGQLGIDGTTAFDRGDPDLVSAVLTQRLGSMDAVFDLISGTSLDRPGGRSYPVIK